MSVNKEACFPVRKSAVTQWNELDCHFWPLTWSCHTQECSHVFKKRCLRAICTNSWSESQYKATSPKPLLSHQGHTHSLAYGLVASEYCQYQILLPSGLGRLHSCSVKGTTAEVERRASWVSVLALHSQREGCAPRSPVRVFLCCRVCCLLSKWCPSDLSSAWLYNPSTVLYDL